MNLTVPDTLQHSLIYEGTVQVNGVISFRVAEGMASLASLCNMIVYRYWGVDDARIYREAKGGGIDTVEEFIREVREYVSKDF